MPIHGYFSKRDDRKLTMPRADEGAPNESGISYQGDVLTGRQLRALRTYTARQLTLTNRSASGR